MILFIECLTNNKIIVIIALMYEVCLITKILLSRLLL